MSGCGNCEVCEPEACLAEPEPEEGCRGCGSLILRDDCPVCRDALWTMMSEIDCSIGPVPAPLESDDELPLSARKMA